MCSQGINGEGKLRGQPANLGSPGKMAVKTEFVCVRTHQQSRKILFQKTYDGTRSYLN